jgi:hypothetical protein
MHYNFFPQSTFLYINITIRTNKKEWHCWKWEMNSNWTCPHNLKAFILGNFTWVVPRKVFCSFWYTVSISSKNPLRNLGAINISTKRILLELPYDQLYHSLVYTWKNQCIIIIMTQYRYLIICVYHSLFTIAEL